MAGNIVDVNRSLKEALLDTLRGILSPMHDVRVAAEEHIKALEVTEEFGVHLAELTVDSRGELPIRQLASVLLKQYVEVHWCCDADKFRSPETSDSAKAIIRQILPISLRENISKVRTSTAYAISAIAHWDWPENWPNLFTILMESLQSGDSAAVHGAMRVMTEFSREVTDIQMTQVAPVILPQIYCIFTQSEVYSIRTRARAVEIFCTCTDLIAVMSEFNTAIAKQLLFPVLPEFIEAFIGALQVPEGATSDSGLKMEILKALSTLVKRFPKQMVHLLPQILTLVWTTLTNSADIYVRTVVHAADEANDPVDSDGEVLGFENLVFSIFEFVHSLLETSRFCHILKKNMDQLIYYIIVYTQMTEEQIKIWINNPDQFVEDEDEDTFSYSVRISAQDLILSLTTEFPEEGAAAVCSAVTTHLREADAAKNSGNSHWWKIHEACFLTLGSVRSAIVEQIQAAKLNFNLNSFFQTIVLEDTNIAVSPFLSGRCLWVASRFCIGMSSELLQRFLEATVGGLQLSQTSCVRISAVRAVWGFCNHLKSVNNTQAVVPYLPHILEGLIALATQFSVEVLALVLETLHIIIPIDKVFITSCENKITPLMIAIFLRNSSDPLITTLTQDIFKVLSQNEGCVHQLQQRLLPTLISILQATTDKIPMGMQAVSLDVLQTIVRNSPVPLYEPLITQAFPAAVRCCLQTDDNSTMQSGGECVRAYISVALDQIVQWQDETGNNGLFYVVQVAIQLLNPKTSEFTAAYVGKLVSTLISKVGSGLGDYLDLLLKGVLSKLQQAESHSVIQSLVMVFAHLIHTQLDAVLEFLSSVPGPTGKAALEFVFTEWCSRQQVFYGSYERKVSSIALCKLLQHGVTANDASLQNILVKGNQIFESDEGIRTRSKNATMPEQWTLIPLLVKVYKLLINELSNILESKGSDGSHEGDSDDINESWCENDDESEEETTEGQTLSSLLNQLSQSDYPGYEVDYDEDEEDPDAVKDPLYQVDLAAYLTEFLQTFSQQPYFNMFSIHTTEQEKQVLKTIGITVC